MKSEKLLESLSVLKDKEARLAAILVSRKSPENFSSIVKAVEGKQLLLKNRKKLETILEKLANKKSRTIAKILFERATNLIISIIEFDSNCLEYLSTQARSKKKLQTLFSSILKGKSDQDEAHFIRLLDGLDALKLKFKELGANFNDFIKIQLEYFNMQAEMKKLLGCLDIDKIPFMKEFFNAD